MFGGVILGPTAVVSAQSPVAVGVVSMATQHPQWGWWVGPLVGVRVGPRDRIVTHLGLGTRGQGALLRLEAVWQYRLAAPTSGARPYLGGGLAFDSDAGAPARVVTSAGLEIGTGREHWIVEAGLGGGLRVALGVRRGWGPPTGP